MSERVKIPIVLVQVVRRRKSGHFFYSTSMPPKPSPKEKAADKQAGIEAERQAKAAAQKEKQDAADWSQGAKDNAKARAAEEKEAERRRKAAENAFLLAAEEAELSNVVRTGKSAKKAGNDDFAMLNAALSKQPKTKAQKEAEAKKAAEEARRKQEAENRERKEAQRKVPSKYFCKHAFCSLRLYRCRRTKSTHARRRLRAWF